MKNFLPFILFAFITIIVISGCTKIEPNPTSSNYMQAVWGGIHYADSTKEVANGSSAIAAKVGSDLVITSQFPDFKLLIDVQFYQGWQISMPVDGVTVYAVKTIGNNFYNATGGYITITNVYPTLKGTYNLQFFSATGDNTVITHGTFSLVSPNPF